jgi:serine/threonine protein kinase
MYADSLIMNEFSAMERGVKQAEDADLERVSRLLASTYEVVGLIGSGGMGNVYFARSNELAGQEVAVKVLHPEFANDPTLRARFLREAELLKKVNHPGVVTFYDAKTENGIAYYAMECITGRTLEDYIKREIFPNEKISELVIKICEALHAVHSVGIIHRDLKPANIMITDSFDIKLTDFGIARPENSQLTHHNEIVGSVCYIPPEIWIGEDPTLSVDLYSLGVVMYELLTGNVPFDGNSPGDLMRKHLQTLPVSPRDVNPKTPLYLNRLTLSLLSKSKFDRPKDALAVIEKINKAQGSITTSHVFNGYENDTQEFLRALDSSGLHQDIVKKDPQILFEKKNKASSSIFKDRIVSEKGNNDSSLEMSEKTSLDLDTPGSKISRQKIMILIALGILTIISGSILLW